MTVKKFVIKTVTKVILFTFLLIIIGAIGPAMRTVISNELAMAQLQPSNEAYILIEAYYVIRPIINVVSVLIAIWCGTTVICDIHNFVKSLDRE